MTFLRSLILGTIIQLVHFSCSETEVIKPVTLDTIVVTGIMAKSAISGGIIVNDGGGRITAKGVCWSTNPNPTINQNKTVDGEGPEEFESFLTNLIENTTYYVRAYATNEGGTAYGPELSFNTLTQIEVDKQIIQAFLTANNILTTNDERGFWYVVNEIGSVDGDSPTLSSTVSINYVAKLLNGTLIDSGSIQARLDALILGLQYGIPLMKVGAKFTFYLPSVYCYGSNGMGNIPPDANMIFEIELLDVF